LLHDLLRNVKKHSRKEEKSSAKEERSSTFSDRGIRWIGLSSSQDSRNPISDKNLILSVPFEGMTRLEWQCGRNQMNHDVGALGVWWNVCQFKHGNDDDDDDDGDDHDHVLSVLVFGNRTSLRMMDDTLIVRIYAPHVPITFLFSRPF